MTNTHDLDPLPKLIFSWNYLEWGGAQIYLLAIMKEAKAEWDVSVVLPSGSSQQVLNFLADEGIPFEQIDACIDLSPARSYGHRIARHFSRFRAEFRTLRHLRKYKLPECILHVEAAPWQSWIFYTVLSLKGANVFVTMHNMLPDRPAWRVAVWKSRLQFVSRLPGFHIFASNHDTRNKLKGWVEDSFWEKIPVTYTCVNPDQIAAATEMPFDKSETFAAHGIPPSRLIVLCVGQFIDRKGRWTFLDAARLVTNSRSDIGFVWVAPEMPDAADRARIDNYGLGDRFRLILSGDVGATRTEILRFFRLGNIFALPSFVEGLPISLLEAMAMGLPSISTNVYAIPEAIVDDETGVLIEAGDPEALARAILALADAPERRDRLAAAGREFVLREFDERAASRIAINQYRKCFE
jgi:glycosyltransferase involved in cell wall biosynthesis